MSQNKMLYSGIVPEKAGLRVVFREDVGGTFRVRQIVIPWADLSSDQVLGQLDNVIRRQLIEEWSGVDIADPLF